MYLLVLFFVVLFLYLKGIYRPHNYPPGPPWQPFMGNTPLLKKLSLKYGGQHFAFQYLAKKYQTNILGLKLGGEYCVVVSSYKFVRQVLLSEDFEGRPDNFFIRLRCMGVRRGLTCTDGPFWMEQRRFVHKSIGFGRKQMEDLVIREANCLLEILANGKPKELQFGSFISPSVLNVLWTLLTGQSLSRNDPFFLNLLELLNTRNLAFDMAGGLLNSMPWLRYLIPDKIGYNLILKLNQDLKDFFKLEIDNHYKSWTEDRRDDLIYSFLTEMYSDKPNYTDQQLLAILLDLFFGGAITTSTTIDFVFLNLVLHPDIQDKAAEALKTLKNEDPRDPQDPITYSDRLKLPYIEAIILETERLHGVIPITAPRRVLKDTYLDGYRLKKDTSVLINFHSVNLDPNYWTEPLSFRPERFINSEGKFVSDEHVLNFALGRRRCIGELLARQCIFIFVSSILRKYRIIQAPGSAPLSDKPLPGIILSPRPYKVVLEARNC